MLDTLLLVVVGPLGILGASLALARLERALDATRARPRTTVPLLVEEDDAREAEGRV